MVGIVSDYSGGAVPLTDADELSCIRLGVPGAHYLKATRSIPVAEYSIVLCTITLLVGDVKLQGRLRQTSAWFSKVATW